MLIIKNIEKFNQEVKDLKAIGLSHQDLDYLVQYLSDADYNKVMKIEKIDDRAIKILNILNDKKLLPKAYSKYVKNYNGFEGIEMPKYEV